MQRLCPRCRQAVTFEEEGSLSFCPHCGAPQVRLSEDLLEQAQAQLHAMEQHTAAPLGGVEAQPGAIDWRGAIRCAALAGLIAFLLEILATALPVLGMLTMFWAVGAPIVILGIYAARFRETRIRPEFGARLGLLSGMAVLLGISSVNIGSLLLSRYVFHSPAAHQMDALFAASFTQAKAAALQQSGAGAAPLLSAFDLPEFRAGTALCVMAFGSALYLVFSTAGGAFAGMLRARKPAA